MAGGPCLRELPEKADAMARADLRKAENVEFRRQIGLAITRARTLLGWSLDRLARECERDERQVSRWERGDEKDRAQFDTLWSVEAFRGPLVIALAELSNQAEVTTTVTLRRVG